MTQQHVPPGFAMPQGPEGQRALIDADEHSRAWVLRRCQRQWRRSGPCRPVHTSDKQRIYRAFRPHAASPTSLHSNGNLQGAGYAPGAMAKVVTPQRHSSSTISRAHRALTLGAAANAGGACSSDSN